MAQTNDTSTDNVDRAALIHRENIQIGVLILIAVGAFLLTRAFANSNRDMTLRDAAEWHRRGQQALAAGRIDDAVEDFHRATVRNRFEKRYVLDLARALRSTGENDEARAALLTLRESAPEDPDINLELARLDADRQDVTEAVRFYHNALYAPWPAEREGERRRIRLELIRFLLSHDQAGRALSELLAVSADVPDDVPTLLEIGRLFAAAGDPRHALGQFQRAVRAAPENRDALVGAGQAAFSLGDYSLARRYLRAAPVQSDAVDELRSVVDLVLSRDPLASRIGSAERRQRLVSNFEYAERRLEGCIAGADPGGSALRNEALEFENSLKTPAAFEPDTIELGVDLVDRIQQWTTRQCGPATVLDRALMLIGHRHRGRES